MSESLRDQLLKSGLARPGSKAGTTRRGGNASRKQGKKPVADSEADLARAYALRAREETREAERARREAQARRAERKERHRKLQALLNGRDQRKDGADIARNFTHCGKIRRVYVDAAQLAALNRGELGVVRFAGRYVLVDADIARKAGAIDPEALALLVDPATSGDDSDGVPDDLMW